MVPAPLNPSRLKQMKAEQTTKDPLAAVPPSPARVGRTVALIVGAGAAPAGAVSS